MDIHCVGLRDRRIAASDETVSVRGAASRVYRESSVAFSRGASASMGRGSRYDREPFDIRALVLHQTAGNSFLAGRPARRLADVDADSRIESDSRLDRIAAHFVVLQDGTIFYTHDVQYLIDSTGGRIGIDIEVAGALPSSTVPPDSSRRLTDLAIRALRNLVTALTLQIPTITHIHPHGQIQSFDTIRVGGRSVAVACGGPGSEHRCGKLVSCPGPDIWVNVGEWACQPAPLGLGLISATPLAPYQNNGIVPALNNPAYDQHVV